MVKLHDAFREKTKTNIICHNTKFTEILVDVQPLLS